MDTLVAESTMSDAAHSCEAKIHIARTEPAKIKTTSLLKIYQFELLSLQFESL